MIQITSRFQFLDKILYFFIAILFYVFLLATVSWSNWLNIYALTLLCIIILGIFLIYKNSGIKLWSFKFLFLIFIIIFHFAQLFLYAIDYDFETMTNFLLYFSVDTVIKTLLFSYLVIVFLMVGMMLPKRHTSYSNKVTGIQSNNKDILQTIAWSFIIFFFPFNIYSSFKAIHHTLTAGYSTINIVEFSALSDLGYLSYTGFSLLLLTYPAKSTKFKVLLTLLLVFLGINMISGGRGMSILVLCLVLFIFFNKTNKKIKLHNAILYGGGAYLIAAFLNSIADVRNFSIINANTFFEVFKYNLEENPILNLFAEMGATFQTTMLIYEQIPTFHNFGFGITFLNSWVTVFPNLNGVFQNIINSINYMLNVKGLALGGSFIGELYYNFGMFGYIFALPIGYLIAKISDSMEKLITNKDYYLFAFYVPIFIQSLWWARGNFSSIIRLTVWNCVLLLIFKFIFDNLSKK